jgi:hypothetical protein
MNILFNVVKRDGELHCEVFHMGHCVAAYSCPAGDDRDQRSDVADLCARAWDAACAAQRVSPRELNTEEQAEFGRQTAATTSLEMSSARIPAPPETHEMRMERMRRLAENN